MVLQKYTINVLLDIMLTIHWPFLKIINIEGLILCTINYHNPHNIIQTHYYGP